MLAAQLPAQVTDLQISLEQLRNRRGILHVCLTREQKHFPDCSRDPHAIKRSVPASETTLRFDGISPGDYALTVLHDENANGKLDTLLGIPREGFGFSRNPVVRFGAPKFRQVRIGLPAGFARQSIRLQYLL